MNGLRACLQDEELTGDPVLCPFDIHRLAVARTRRIMVLDGTRPTCELQDLESRKAESISLSIDNVADESAGSVVIKDHLDLFYAEFSRNDRPETELQRGLEDDPFIGRRHALNNGFAKSPGSVNDDRIAKSALGVEREHNARTRKVRADHRLNSDRKSNVEVVESLCRAVR